jgi:hypothetical protein
MASPKLLQPYSIVEWTERNREFPQSTGRPVSFVVECVLAPEDSRSPYDLAQTILKALDGESK